MDVLKCNKCEYQEPRQSGYCYMFENEPVECLKYMNTIEAVRKEFKLPLVKIKDLDRIEIDEKAMNEALKKTALYQFGEYGKAIEDCKECIKDEVIRLRKCIIDLVCKFFLIFQNLG